jgi:uncharacterized protein (DUF1697 family)
MARYAAFLRGINVGGNKKVPMAKLKTVMETMGFENVKTLLASGNVIFEGKKEDTKKLAAHIAKVLGEAFGFEIPVLIRTMEELEKLHAREPFAKIKVTKDIRLYVTFLSEKPKSKLKIPYESPDKAFRILALSGSELISVLDVSKTGTPEAMSIIEKEFGKNVTTRNWNTIVKMVGVVSS